MVPSSSRRTPVRRALLRGWLSLVCVLGGAVVPARAGADELWVRGHHHQLTGTPRDDVLHGSDGADRLDGRGGRDRIEGRGGDDTIVGDGRDRIAAGRGDDRIR